MSNINKFILIDYIYKTSEIGKGVIIEGVDILSLKDNGLTTLMKTNIKGRSKYTTVDRPSLFVNVHFDNGGRKNSIFHNLSYPHFIEYSNKIRTDKLNKLKKLCIEGK